MNQPREPLRTPSVREAGSLFLVGFHGTRCTAEVRDLLDDLNPSGVVLFSRNVENPRQLAALNREIQRHCIQRTGEGIFIAVDQEGGRVRRLREGFTGFPSALEMACSQDPESAVRRFAEVTARELRLVGFNLDFVPVLDVLTAGGDPGSSVIGDRSFGSDPSVVSQLGRIVIETMRSNGVITCCKHFPGHGGTSVDSHHELPVDGRPRQALLDTDLVPFRYAMDGAADMIMTAHVLYPGLDVRRPATLSPTILTGLLRDEMGYKGVLVTDDLDMGAVSKQHAASESALMAFAAGADLLLICNSPEKAVAARDAVYEALKTGAVPLERWVDSTRRIRALKERFAESLRPCNAGEDAVA